MTSDPGAPVENYARRAQQFGSRAEQLAGRSALIANFRGLAFAGLLVLLLVALFGNGGPLVGVGVLLLVAVFVFFVVWHGRVLAEQETALRWWYVNDHAHKRVSADWRSLPDLGEGLAPADHPYAGDLDLFGNSSLFQRINVAHTRFGQQVLARWLAQAGSVAEARTRQAIARRLSSELELRQELEARALSLSLPRVWTRGDAKPIPPPDPEPLLRWAEARSREQFSTPLLIVVRGMPLITLLAVVVALFFAVPTVVWALPVSLQIVLLFRFREATFETYNSVSLGQNVFSQYGPMLQLLSKLLQQVPELHALRERVGEDLSAPEQSMREFARWVGWFELRSNPLVHPVANAFLLWDVHCTIGLTRWRERWGSRVRGWFEALGEAEAYSSLAGIAHDNPGFAWPELHDEQVLFQATDLAHPLIESEARVGNSVDLPEAGRALLVTGSNMSGKSTLLRAMGLAQVMALAGAPVCASRLSTCGLSVCTSLRISDSLEQGVSHFYAELRKLKAVVETARERSTVLFLLDEILHGTNSLERQVGARWVLSELLQRGAIGAVSTHDTGLCELPPQLMQRVTQVHLRETVQDERMTFDYKVRPGPVQGGNALRLMRSLGLDVPLVEQP